MLIKKGGKNGSNNNRYGVGMFGGNNGGCCKEIGVLWNIDNPGGV